MSSFFKLLPTLLGSNESNLGSIASFETRKELEKEKDKDRDRDKDKPAGHMPREGSLRSVLSSSGISLDSFSNTSTTLQNTVISPIVKKVLSGTLKGSLLLVILLRNITFKCPSTYKSRLRQSNNETSRISHHILSYSCLILSAVSSCFSISLLPRTVYIIFLNPSVLFAGLPYSLPYLIF